jgi:hypothetical protein
MPIDHWPPPGGRDIEDGWGRGHGLCLQDRGGSPVRYWAASDIVLACIPMSVNMTTRLCVWSLIALAGLVPGLTRELL